MPTKRRWPVKHNRSAYRSGLEEAVAAQLKSAGVKINFETHKIPFIQPLKNRKYTPDFILPNGIIIETKGQFSTDDRNKHIWVQAQHPCLEIRFVFSYFNSKIYKGSKTTCAMWCKKHNFKYAQKLIPKAWLNEPVNPKWIKANEVLIKINKRK